MTVVVAAAALGVTAVPAQAVKVNVYMARGSSLQIVQRTVPAGTAGLTSSVRSLFAGPTRAERRDGVVSRIPGRTRLREVVVRDHVAYVRVSNSFVSSGSGSQLAARFGQLIYTVLQYRHVDAVRLLLDDEPMPAAGVVDSKLLDHGSAPRVEIIPVIPIGVRGAQRRLIALRYLPRGSANGRLDYRTSQALLAFQGWESVLRTGTVTLSTRVRLAKARIPVPRRRTVGRRIEVTRAKGVLLEIKGRRVVRAIHVSTGAGGRTPAGLFGIYRKERMSWSYPFGVWLPWASYFHGGYAFHEYPHVPGYSASHGCIRVGSPEARGVFRFATYGTPVSIV